MGVATILEKGCELLLWASRIGAIGIAVTVATCFIPRFVCTGGRTGGDTVGGHERNELGSVTRLQTELRCHLVQLQGTKRQQVLNVVVTAEYKGPEVAFEATMRQQPTQLVGFAAASR
eukprot:2916174-Prymnesium_polylepis.1